MTGETGRQTDTRLVLYAMDVVSDNDNDRRVNLWQSTQPNKIVMHLNKLP